jgi:predicted amidohydrolase YtcJ
MNVDPRTPRRVRLVRFTGLLVVLCFGSILLLALTARPRTPEPADAIFLNGHIYTSNPKQPSVEAIAIRGRDILAVGSTKDLQSLRGPNTKMFDLAGRMAMPGLIDTHTHFLQASGLLAGVSIAGLEGVDAVKGRLREYAAAHPGDGWIYGGGWDYGGFWAGGLPTKALLDELFPHRPVALVSSDTHSIWVNSRALAIAKITHDTPNPNRPELRGIIMRDPKTGEATGVLEEGATRLITDAIPATDDQRLALLRKGMAYANQQGITGVINASGDIAEMQLYARLHERGELTVRTVTAMSDGVGTRHTLTAEELATFEQARRQFQGDWVRAGLIKFFADGVIETHSAAMLEPYANAKFSGEKGTTLYTPEELRRDLMILDTHQFQVMTHAVGDAAVREVLDAYEAVEKQDGPRDRRWRIEHLEVVSPDDLGRLAPLKIIAAFQPWCCTAVGDPWGDSLGEARWSDGTPWQKIASSGATVILGSDWPVEPIDPFAIIQTGLTRQTPDGQPAGGFFPKQALTLDQMLAGYTRNAAYSEFMENRLGTLETGKLADLVVLSQDLYKIAPHSIGKTKVLLTMVDGKIVWRDGL